MSTPLFGAQTLIAGKTAGGVSVPFKCGADGSLNGTTNNPTIHVGPRTTVLGYGRTAGGVNVPVLVSSDGTVQFS